MSQWGQESNIHGTDGKDRGGAENRAHTNEAPAHLCRLGPSRNLRHLRQILDEALRGRCGEGVGVPSWKVHVLRAVGGASWAAEVGHGWATAVIHAHHTDTITDNMTISTTPSSPTPPAHCTYVPHALSHHTGSLTLCRAPLKGSSCSGVLDAGRESHPGATGAPEGRPGQATTH